MNFTPSKRSKYLFIRILEGCNADCFMCGFALSKDKYRFSKDDMKNLIPQAKSIGTRFVRFTGGEPLLHREIFEFVSLCSNESLCTSLITNGFLLEQQVERLAKSGLQQVVVSIDAASAEAHDKYRNMRGLFNRAIAGIRATKQLGLLLRVNTVVGPHNYEQMPALRDMLVEVGVDQWELSTLKLDQKLRYDDIEAVLAVGKIIYESPSRLVPMGVPWYGATKAQQEDYFFKGIPPRPNGSRCHVTDDIIYLDGKNEMLFACSCLPHRKSISPYEAPLRLFSGVIDLTNEQFESQKKQYALVGPTQCQGCSSTAAKYSDFIESVQEVPCDWSY